MFNGKILCRLVVFGCLTTLFVCSGCTPKFRPFSINEAKKILDEQTLKVKTVRGKAWVSADSVQGSASFPAVIALDRTEENNPKMRIEARDPFGTTHTLMILKDDRLVWIDFNKKKKNEVKKNWQGLPLNKLPELILGIGNIPKQADYGAVKEDSFVVNSKKGTHIQYQMTWINPGPRLALAGLSGELRYSVNRGYHHIRDEYHVEYSQFLEKDDFYLPDRIDVVSHRAVNENAKEKQLEFKVRWRQREWNANIPDAVFKLPKINF